MQRFRENTFFTFLNKEKENIVFALFIAVYLLLQIFKFPDFRIIDFSDFAFGEATSSNVSVGRRVAYFYNGIFVFAGLFSVIYFLFKFLIKRFNPKKIRFQIPFALAGLGLMLSIVNVFGADSKNFTGIILVLFLFSLLISLFGRKQKVFKLLNTLVFVPIIIYSILLISGVFYIISPDEGAVEGSVLWFALSFLLVSSLFLLFESKWGQKFSLLIFKPLVWVPTFAFLSTEIVIAIKYSGNPLIDYQIIFFILFGLICILSFFKFKRRPVKKQIHNLFSKQLVFGVLSMITVFSLYAPIVHYPVELFESANVANAQMRLFEFGEIPLVDFMSSHMLQEQWTGWIYHLIHGYSGDFSFIAYFFLNDLVFLLVLYFILKEILNDSLSPLLVIVCLPFLADLFNPALLFGVLPIFFLKRLLSNASTLNYLRLFGVVLFIILWKLDTGFACLVASSILLLILWITKQIEFKLKPILTSAGLSVLILLTGLGITFIIRSPEYILENINSALHYFRAGQSHGLSQITREINQDFYIHYFLLPLVAVILVIVTIIELRNQKDKIPFVQLTGVFFLLFFLGNFQRGLVRHSFMEKLDFYWSSFFFVGLIFLFIHWFAMNNRGKKIVFLLVGNLSLFLIFKPFAIGERQMMIEQSISNPTHIGFKKHLVESRFKNRVEIDEKLQAEYQEIVKYLKENLNEGETFYDFSNTPLLYYLAQKQQPSYFCQNLQNTVGDYLQFKQIETLKESNVPILVYQNEPLTFWDRTDNVDNTLRYYLIAEYLFRNYKPDSVIGTKWVWKESPINEDEDQADLKTYRFIDYGKSAGIWTSHLKEKNDVLGEEIELKLEKESHRNNFQVRLDSNIQKEVKAGFLQLEFELISNMYPEDKLNWTVHIFNDKNVVATSRFEGFENRLIYTLRLTNFYNWHRGNVDFIRIYPEGDSEERMGLKSVRIIKDKRIEG